MIKTGIIGIGKMGISHLAILGAHQDVQVVGVCDQSKMMLDAIEKYSPFSCFTDYRKMLDTTMPDAVVVAVPTKFHASMVAELLDRNIHVFVEKPFCLSEEEAPALIKQAREKRLVNQVGYHNKFIGTFREVKRIVNSGAIGDIYHFHGQSYGPVVIRAKQESWRTNPEEGGGCLMDYASHVIDLLNDIIAPVESVSSSQLKRIFSREVEDAVYATMELRSKVSGMLSVNWSDETFRKMTTSITINGCNGKIISDANELKVYFKEKEAPAGYSTGWNVKYVTDLTEPVDYYLRGEEYSAQLDYFIQSVKGTKPNLINTFESASLTDKAISMIRKAQS